MTEPKYLEIFGHNGIKPTAIRLLVYRAMMHFERAFSLMDLEEVLDTVDKSTIFRAITLFHEHHLIHSVDDGSGSLKYCVCHNGGDCSLEELHCHFYCERCKRTFCLDETPVPLAETPEGFRVRTVSYVMKGICPSCASSKDSISTSSLS
jgi:Fur family transcriptional regulator, ferric uptake regulator